MPKYAAFMTFNFSGSRETKNANKCCNYDFQFQWQERGKECQKLRHL